MPAQLEGGWWLGEEERVATDGDRVSWGVGSWERHSSDRSRPHHTERHWAIHFEKGKSTARESYVPKNSFWGSLRSQFLPAGLTGEGSPWEGLFCPGDLRTSPRHVVLFLPVSLPGPVSHLSCPVHRPECSRREGTDALTSLRKVHDVLAAYKVQKPQGPT